MITLMQIPAAAHSLSAPALLSSCHETTQTRTGLTSNAVAAPRPADESSSAHIVEPRKTKTPNGHARPDSLRDAYFSHLRRAAERDRPRAVVMEASVGTHSTDIEPTEIEHEHADDDAALADLEIADTKPSLVHPKKRRKFRYWHDKIARDLKARHATFTTPSTWGKLDSRAKDDERYYAIMTLGPAMSLNGNLSEKIELVARGKLNPAGWLLARCTRELKLIGINDPQMSFRLEEEGLDPPKKGREDTYDPIREIDVRERRLAMGLPANNRLHLHGMILVSLSDAAVVRGALRKALGEWNKEARNKQIKLVADPDDHWPSYGVKGSKWVWLRKRFGRVYLGLQIDGRMSACTEQLNRLASQRYDAWRKYYMDTDRNLSSEIRVKNAETAFSTSSD